jgi:hypothetical protein
LQLQVGLQSRWPLLALGQLPCHQYRGSAETYRLLKLKQILARKINDNNPPFFAIY